MNEAVWWSTDMSDVNKSKPKRKRVHTPFATNLKRVLDERSLSIRGAAEICGVNQAVVHAWLNGTQPHDAMAVLKLCKALSVDYQWLMTGTQPEIRVRDLSLNQVFDIEHDPAFSGIFMIEAKRLKRRQE